VRNSAYEALLTAVLLFGVASVVRWVIGASPISQAIPGIHLELLVVGVVVGLLLAGLILSPLGKASGGHLNPAISLAMWRFGVFPGRGVLTAPRLTITACCSEVEDGHQMGDRGHGRG